MNREQAKELIEKYDRGLASAEEKALLDNWFLYESRKSEFTDNDHKFLLLKSQIWQATLQQSGLKSKPYGSKISLWLGMAAAMVLIGLSAVLFVYVSSEPLQVAKEKYANDVAPGGNKATLTLSNGKKISLTDAQNGSLIKQTGVNISKLADGQIIYQAVSADNSAESQRNTVENKINTPNGGKYQVILPDGTKVTLNAASSLTFPTTFTGPEREVKLDGEAYFEVAKDKNKPFRVNSGIQTIEVLGTHFNINAYANEQTIKTTLMEGSVKVSVGEASTLIVPGQQTIIDRDKPQEINKGNADIDKETAWKNDIFLFEKDDLKSVMRQISRWYDVEVVYTGTFPHNELFEFFGGISRKSNLSEIATILELYNVHLEITGRVVKVTYVPPSSDKSRSNKIN